ncbi:MULTISPECIES: 2'-5' RNA ligase family protein [unclassified Mucilaginibacter]|uniref:2'-5' RNA ligase family protein n=1 Tax=unclassified Mucilaginibacter TaxID=2617802 RepID=UPI002AC8E64A|nr:MULTISPECIES: 2'-5' RNA ligase family protein [unclassified Mucilaginibacter]MEB0260796.1 2'-5' RNA ligase family protein [Mucilaginibacter sp. 10I4]MEB0279011.1 2'-5' RNA ligase family protein [Mucilaginibacter sp. 10B2]MEB0299970.1 2'-5' RNA ligase family protein [Mucilaginibacter sp. 5C4]WPX22189.1 2'-5' RNA ligase family protein [Mucilaginibacter sp. 5C4]
MTSYSDYLFLLSPPEPVKELIGKYKKASAKHIGNFKSMDAPAHISVIHMERQKPYYADHTVSQIERAINIMPPVLLHIDGFKYFSHLHSQYTIYAHIRITPAVDAWFTLLKKNLSIRKTLVPHVTVVRNVSEADFKTLWPHFKHKKVIEPFWIKELKIVKRETFGGSLKWEAFKTFGVRGMRNLEVVNNKEVRKQINLF